MISCVACTHFTLRDVGEMARRSCGRCEQDAKHSYYPALREWDCDKFSPAEAGLVEKRKEWLSARN